MLDEYEKTLTVSELICKLQVLEAQGHGLRAMITEGCDCTGNAGSVTIEGDDVCILRTKRKPLSEEEVAAKTAAEAAAEAAELERNQRVLKILAVRPLTEAEQRGDFTNSDAKLPDF